ncbi:hypothetical protein R6Z07M_009254 [Ovis aries]
MGPVPLPLSQASRGRCRRHQYWAFLLGFRGVTVAFKKERRPAVPDLPSQQATRRSHSRSPASLCPRRCDQSPSPRRQSWTPGRVSRADDRLEDSLLPKDQPDSSAATPECQQRLQLVPAEGWTNRPELRGTFARSEPDTVLRERRLCASPSQAANGPLLQWVCKAPPSPAFPWSPGPCPGLVAALTHPAPSALLARHCLFITDSAVSPEESERLTAGTGWPPGRKPRRRQEPDGRRHPRNATPSWRSPRKRPTGQDDAGYSVKWVSEPLNTCPQVPAEEAMPRISQAPWSTQPRGSE